MKHASTKVLLRLVGMSIILSLCLNTSQGDEPHINPHFPLHDGSNLSPPIVRAPIHECARAVFVSGFVPKAIVKVLANGSELLGQDNPPLGFAVIKLTRALVLGDSITATQTVGPVTSLPSYVPVIVGAYPALSTPVIGPDIYACGRIVPVGNLVASTHIEVSDLDAGGAIIGSGEATGEWEPVFTSSLVAPHRISAKQIACPGVADKTVKSSPSAAVTVKPEPSPLPVPNPDQPVTGNDVVTLHNLLVGAEIQIKAGPSPIGGGFATAPDNWARVSPPIVAVPPGNPITATQKLCSTSQPSPPVNPVDHLPAPVLGAPICEGSRTVSIDNTVLNANVVLLRAGSIIGYGGATPGTLNLSVGAGVTLNGGNAVSVVQYIGTVISPPSNTVMVGCGGGANVVTQHNDNFRTGAYLAETTLTPAAVLSSGMRVKYRHTIDGSIAAQPLYVREVAFPTGGANGLFVATLANKVYALDANTGMEKWVKTLADSDLSRRGLTRAISSTPVIDVPNHRMYVLFSTKNQAQDTANCPDSTNPDCRCGTYEDQLSKLDIAYWLVALDYRDGNEVGRVQVAASLARGNGMPLNFTAKYQFDRTALLLDHGSVYIAFCMRFREEIVDYHGWVLRYRASDLAFQGAFNTSRNITVPTSPFTSHRAEGAGIWQGGGGLAADPDGNVYFLTGNARADIANDLYGDNFVKLTPAGASLIPTAFVPSGADRLDTFDADLGSGGALTIPGFNLVVGGGKTGFMYLLDRGAMSLAQQITASTNQYDPSLRDQGWDVGPHLHGSPTYWRGPDPTFGYLYVWGEKDVLRQYRFNTVSQRFEEPAIRQGAIRALPDTMPGGILSVSANGNTAGSGVLWATLPASDVPPLGAGNFPGHLYAFHAESLQPLWDTAFSSLGKWLPPTIAGGKVFIGTSSNELIAYELGSHRRRAPRPYHPRKLLTRGRLHERYPDEESIRALPAIALGQLAPPGEHVTTMILEGRGEQIYMARESDSGKLVWEWKRSKARLSDVSPETAGYDRPRTALRILLEAGPVWSASDGSRASAEVQRIFPAPEKEDAPWTLFRVIQTSDSGALSKLSYVQAVFTRGGAPPAEAPRRKGNTRRAPYYAQYVFLR